MSNIIKKPTYNVVLAELKKSTYGMVRGIVATNGEIFMGSAEIWTHDKIAAEAGVEFYESFILSAVEEDDGIAAEMHLDYPAIYSRLRFLHKRPISVATVGVVPAKNLSETD